MSNTIAIRREDLSKAGERRVAITPKMAQMIHEMGCPLLVQPGIHPETQEDKRVFPDIQYQQMGAEITEEIEAAEVIFGLKEIEKQFILPEKAYYFFSHTHKGQVKNRQMLKRIVQQQATLIDYELIRDAENRRLITAFTYFAGYAGMIDTLWALGQRLSLKGIMNPFFRIPQSIEKEDLEMIKGIITAVGNYIRTEGTPESQPPLITVFLGNGKTSTGAQEIYDLLPVTEIGIEDLAHTFQHGSRNTVYKLVMTVPTMFRPKASAPFANQKLDDDEFQKRYFAEPHHFESNLDQVYPYCTLLMNCIIWSPEYPRLLTREDANRWFERFNTLEVIGDITCDPEGAIEFSKECWIDDPVFIYHPLTQTSNFGMDGAGIAVMAVTNLPTEFPADASQQFSDDLKPLLAGIVEADYQASDASHAGLPAAVERAVILWKGQFTENYDYMEAYL